MPRRGLSRRKVLDAAVVVIDRDGLANLSMRRLGKELGVEAMSLYRHVADKADLLDGVYETILNELEIPRPSGDWQADARHVAHSFRDVLLRHPGAMPLFVERPAVTVPSLRQLDASLAVVAQGGFHVAESLAVLQIVLGYIVGYWMTRVPAPGSAPVEAPYDDLDPGEFPFAAGVGAVLAQHDPAAEFELGLDALLSGLAERLKAEPS